MKLLIDTHVLAWLGGGDRRLSPALTTVLSDPNNPLLVSAVIAYEYADLHARGRFRAGPSFDELQRTFRFDLVDFPVALWRRAADLPDIHRDPVDRMLIAHALAIDATLVTADADMRRYPVKTLW